MIFEQLSNKVFLDSNSVCSELEVQLWQNPLKDSFHFIPPSEQISNQHLYTCKRPSKEPLVLSLGELSIAAEPVTSVYPYTLKSVFDLSAKGLDLWCTRRFDSMVCSREHSLK